MTFDLCWTASIDLKNKLSTYNTKFTYKALLCATLSMTLLAFKRLTAPKFA